MSAWAGVGTRVYTNKGEGTVIIVPPSIKNFVPPDGSREVPGIRTIDISIQPGEIISAQIELACEFEPIEAVPTYYAVNPKTGELELVKLIEFESGNKWEYGS